MVARNNRHGVSNSDYCNLLSKSNQWWMLSSPIFGFSSLSHILVSFTLISQLVGYGLLFSIATVRPICCSCACFYGVGDSILRLVPPFHVVQWCALLFSLDRLVAASSLVWNCSLGFPASLLAPCRVSLRFTCNRISLLLQSWLARCGIKIGPERDPAPISVRFASTRATPHF